MNKTREIAEAGLFAALIAIMIIGAYFVPLAGSLITMFLPLPIIVLTMKNKVVNVVFAAIVGIVVSGMFITFVGSVPLGGIALMVGLPIGLAMRYKQKTLVTILVGTVFGTAAFIAIFALIEQFTGVSLFQIIEESFKLSAEMQGELTAILGAESTTATADAQKLLSDMLYLIKLIMPAFMIVFSMFYAMLNVVMAHQILKRLRIDHIPLGRFEDFSYPKHLAYGSMGMLVLSYIVGAMGLVDLELITTNFAFLFTNIFVVQGFAVIYFFMKGRVGKVTSIVIIVLLSVFGLMQYISFLGFFDVLMDLRKPRIKGN